MTALLAERGRGHAGATRPIDCNSLKYVLFRAQEAREGMLESWGERPQRVVLAEDGGSSSSRTMRRTSSKRLTSCARRALAWLNSRPTIAASWRTAA
jgi:hypothetical protein